MVSLSLNSTTIQVAYKLRLKRALDLKSKIVTTKEVEEMNIRDPLFRRALWEAHNKRCAYSGEPIRFSDLQIEHIVPKRIFDEPEKLKSLLVELGLPEDFQRDNPKNLLPTLGFSNRQKSDSVDPLQLTHALNNASSKLSNVKEIYNQIKSNDEIDIAKLRLFHGVRTGEISTSDIGALLNEVRIGNTSGILNRPLVFADKEFVNISEVSDPCSLLDIAISPRVGGLPHLTLIDDMGKEMVVKNCRDWLNGIDQGYYAKSNYDIKESAFFEAVSSLVWALKNRKPPLDSYLSEGLFSLERLPPKLLPHLSGDEIRALEKHDKSGETVKSLLEAEAVIPDIGEFSVRFEYQHMEAFMWEVLRGDFSGDGCEDILISKYEKTIEGTYATSDSLILSAGDKHSNFEVKSLTSHDFIGLLND